MRKTLHQINNHTTCIIPSLFIELPVLRHESEWSCICVLVVMYMCVSDHVYVCSWSFICVLVVCILPLSTIFRTVLTFNMTIKITN